MRATYRCSRAGSAKHNDRSFNLDKADHIDQGRTSANENWHCFRKVNPDMSFTEVEETFYAKRYSEALEATNKRYREQYHPERCKTIQDLLKGPKTRPEEVIFQIGDKDVNPGIDVLRDCMRDLYQRMSSWNKDHGRHLHILNYSIHLDEKTPHIHQRQCWDYIDKDGHYRLGQEKALEASGVELPDPDKPVGRYNNRKMSFDKMIRSMWLEVLQDHGLEVETIPRPRRKNKIKEAFIDGQIAKKQDELQRLESQIE